MQLSPQDAQFLYLETDNYLTHVTTVMILDPDAKGVGFEELRRHFEVRLAASPIFHQHLVRVAGDLDYPYWADDPHFDLEYHVHQVAAPSSGDWSSFRTWLSDLHSRPLDMRRPLWELHIVEGLRLRESRFEGSLAVVFKVHHTAMDGGALARFFITVTDASAESPPPTAPPASSPPSPRPSEVAQLRRAATHGVLMPARMGREVLRSAPVIAAAVREQLRPRARNQAPRREIPVTRFERDDSPHRTFDATRFPLAELNAFRALAPGSTLNDVVLTLVGGALRRYLARHGELPEVPLVAWVPVNARRRGSDEGGNQLAAMTASLFTTVEDPVERLRAVHDGMRRSKSGRSGASARLLTAMTQNIPAFGQPIIRRVLIESPLRARLCNLFVSNVRGPSEPRFLAGARVTHLFGAAPLGLGMGLFIGTPSYAGEMTFSITSNRETMPDVGDLIQDLEEARNELRRGAR
ncbi:MAG: wax ester/triacylglycerol synthase family O-acyltransferase [Myxococcota bacterium]